MSVFYKTCFMVFALIKDDEVKNLSVGDYYHSDQNAKALYGEDAYAVDATSYPVDEGDKYVDNEFRRYAEDGSYEVINRLPSDAEEITRVETETTEKTDTIEDTIDTILTEVIPEMLGGNE